MSGFLLDSPSIAPAFYAVGVGYISGQGAGLVTVNGVPSARWVEIRHRRSRLLLWVQFANSDGTYKFINLDPNEKFDVVARDYNNVYNDVIRSNITPAT